MKNKRILFIILLVAIIFVIFVFFYKHLKNNIDYESLSSRNESSLENSSKYDISKLEALYESNSNYRTLELIIQNYEPSTTTEFEKLIHYYEELFKTADAETIERNQYGYAEILYEAKKDRYYEIVNSLLNKNAQTEKYDMPKKMSKAVLLLQPIMNHSSSKSDYEFALNKLRIYDNSDTLIDFHYTYILYSTYCRLYNKLGDNENLKNYKNKIISVLNRELSSDPLLEESKSMIIEELNTFISS